MTSGDVYPSDSEHPDADVEWIYELLAADFANNYQRRIAFASLRGVSHGAVDAEDLVQDTYLNLLSNPINIPTDNIGAYVGGTMKHSVSNSWRNIPKWREVSRDGVRQTVYGDEASFDQPDNALTPEDIAIENDSARRLADILEKVIPKEDLLLLIDYSISRNSGEAVAEMYGISPNTVRAKCWRTTDRIRKMLHDGLIELPDYAAEQYKDRIDALPQKPDPRQVFADAIQNRPESAAALQQALAEHISSEDYNILVASNLPGATPRKVATGQQRPIGAIRLSTRKSLTIIKSLHDSGAITLPDLPQDVYYQIRKPAKWHVDYSTPRSISNHLRTNQAASLTNRA